MLRITGGEFRGRMIHTPAHLHTRPTQARLRQALFNSLQMSIPDANVLDLFAGSGALGFEALSRGARRVTFVESDRSTIKLIEKNAETLRVTSRVRIIWGAIDQADKTWRRILEDAPYDVVLADPPYEGGWEMRLLSEMPWAELLQPDGLFCLEWGRVKSKVVDELPDQVPFLVKVREKIYGESVLSSYRRIAGESGDA